MIKINYSYELKTYIEKIRFEKQRYFDILRYLSLQSNIKKETIEEYYNKAFESALTFEILKEEIVNITCPPELKNLDLKYNIKLDEGSIEYEL